MNQRRAERVHIKEDHETRLRRAEVSGASARKQIVLIKDRLADQERALAHEDRQFTKGLSTNDRVMAARQRVSETRIQLGEQERLEVAAAEEAIQVKAQMSAQNAQWRSVTGESLQQARRVKADRERDLREAEFLSHQDVLRADRPSVILDVTGLGMPGGQPAGEVLVRMMPLDAEVEIQVELEPRDAGWVRPGAKARVKVVSLPFQRHGALDATVRAVSPDSVLRDSVSAGRAGRVQRAFLEITSHAGLHSLPDGFLLWPGLEVTAEVKIGRRTPISYVTSGLAGAFSGAFGGK